MTPTLIKSYFPEFASLSDGFIQLYIDQAVLSINTAVWLGKSELGVAYLTAHLLTLINRGGNGQAGPLTQESVGDLSRSYGQVTIPNANEYSLTVYGVEYLRLRKSLIISPMVL